MRPSPVTVVRSESPELCLILIIMGDDHICSELFGRLGVSMTERRLAAARALEHEIPPANENLLAAVVPLRIGVFLVGGGWVHHVVVVVVEDETPLGEVDHRPGIGHSRGSPPHRSARRVSAP